MVTSNKLKHFASILLFVAIIAITLADVPRPLGVPLVKAALYQPGPDDKWQCLDGSKIIKFLQINDDYCDCPDGSDEPGTAACVHGRFHCINRGHRAEDLPSSRVNDGICDCCDGSDEHGYKECSNTCDEIGLFEKEQRKSQAEMLKRGSVKRSEMVSRGRLIKAEREKHRQELEQRRQEQELLRNEKEELKKLAETAEEEAIRRFEGVKRIRHVAEVFNILHGAEASEYFAKYDTNEDRIIEVAELQADINLDKDGNGEVTIEEVKFFLDQKDSMDYRSYFTMAWPRIKVMQLIAAGTYKPNKTADGEIDFDYKGDELDQIVKKYNEDRAAERYPEDPHPLPYPFEEPVEAVDDEEPSFDKSFEANQKKLPDYDLETKRAVDSANEARNAVSEIESTLREIDQEIKDIDEQNTKDYGPQDEYAALEGECYKFEDREYVYTLCPFERASQQPRSGGSETTLGRWDQWLHEDGQKYQMQKYAHGASCWNGPQRSTIVQITCALESRITSVGEPNRCEYFFEFETPAACDEEAFNAEEQRLRDEL